MEYGYIAAITLGVFVGLMVLYVTIFEFRTFKEIRSRKDDPNYPLTYDRPSLRPPWHKK